MQLEQAISASDITPKIDGLAVKSQVLPLEKFHFLLSKKCDLDYSYSNLNSKREKN